MNRSTFAVIGDDRNLNTKAIDPKTSPKPILKTKNYCDKPNFDCNVEKDRSRCPNKCVLSGQYKVVTEAHYATLKSGNKCKNSSICQKCGFHLLNVLFIETIDI